MAETISSWIYDERNPDKKDKQWANRLISLFRMYWRPLVDSERAVNGRAVMYSMGEIPEIRDSFKEKKFRESTKFVPLPLMESYVNTIVEETIQIPPHIDVKAQDPLSLLKKDKDITKLKARKILESDATKIRLSVGMPPYKMPYDEFEGNIEDFDNMGMEDNDMEDISDYRNNFQKLRYEIGAQSAINSIVKLNQFDEVTIRTLVKDAMAYKAISVQAYVDQITGEFKYRYLDPSLLYGIWGRSNDGKGDICRGWYDLLTIGEFLSLVGDDFDFERDWKDVLFGINFTTSNKKYTGFIRGGKSYSCLSNTEDRRLAGVSSSVSSDSLISWDDAYLFKINVGYIEWPSWSATSSFIKNGDDVREVDYEYEITSDEKKSGYQKTTKYQQVWYRSYMVASSTVTQCLFGFQKIYFQHIEGLYDEYSNGTISYWQEQGKSVSELASPYLDLANFAFYRFKWLIWHVKPAPEDYVMDELLTLAKTIEKEMPQGVKTGDVNTLQSFVEKAIEFQRKGHIRLRTFPIIEGKKYPQLPPIGEKHENNGIDPTAAVMQAIIEWADQHIQRAIGFSPMRFGANPPSRESLKTEQNILSSSQNATGYIYRSIQAVKEHMARVTLNYISDVMQYPSSIPYRWLNKLIGDTSFGYIKSFGKEIAHRAGIFVSDVNYSVMRQRMLQAADLALNKGSITLDQWNLLFYMQDYKMANARLAMMERHKERKLKREQVETEQRQHQNNLMLEQEKQRTASIPANAQVESAKVGAMAQVQSAKIQADGRLDVKKLQVDSEPDKQRVRTDNQKELMREKSDIENQQPFITGEG